MSFIGIKSSSEKNFLSKMEMDRGGVASLLRDVSELEDAMKVRIINNATRRAAKTTLEYVKGVARSRRKTGAMSENYKVKKMRGNKGYLIASPTRNDLATSGRPEALDAKGYYPAAQEYGTKYVKALSPMRRGFKYSKDLAFDKAIKSADRAIFRALKKRI